MREVTMHDRYFTHQVTGRTVLAMTPAQPDADASRVRWLDADEREVWSALASVLLLVPGELEAPLQREAGLTLFEYLVLSHASEVPGRRLRMSELAQLANGSLSRLSNVVRRFEDRGWMTRSPDPDDGRYTTAGLTEEGLAVVEAAAPVHLASVRRSVLEPLAPRDREALVRIAAALVGPGLPPTSPAA